MKKFYSDKAVPNSIISSFYDKDYFLFYESFPYIRRQIFLSMLSKNFKLSFDQHSRFSRQNHFFHPHSLTLDLPITQRTGKRSNMVNRFMEKQSVAANVKTEELTRSNAYCLIKAYFNNPLSYSPFSNKSNLQTSLLSSQANTRIGPKLERSADIPFNKLYFPGNFFFTWKKIYGPSQNYFFQFYKTYFNQILAIDDFSFNFFYKSLVIQSHKNYVDLVDDKSLISETKQRELSKQFLDSKSWFREGQEKKINFKKNPDAIKFLTKEIKNYSKNKKILLSSLAILSNSFKTNSLSSFECLERIIILTLKYHLCSNNLMHSSKNKLTKKKQKYLNTLFLKDYQILRQILKMNLQGLQKKYGRIQDNNICIPKEFIYLSWPFFGQKDNNIAKFSKIRYTWYHNFLNTLSEKQSFSQRKKKLNCPPGSLGNHKYGYVNANGLISNLARLMNSNSIEWYIRNSSFINSLSYLRSYWMYISNSHIFFLTENIDNNNESNHKSINFDGAQEALQKNITNIGDQNLNIRSIRRTTAKAVITQKTNDKKLKSLRWPILNKDPKIKNFITDYFKIYQMKFPAIDLDPKLSNKNIDLSHLQDDKDKIQLLPHERRQEPINYKAKTAKILLYIIKRKKPLFVYITNGNLAGRFTKTKNLNQLIINIALTKNPDLFNIRQTGLSWLVYNLKKLEKLL